LSCPVCGGPLAAADGSARCERGHSFDYARSGYLNLTRATGARARNGDTAAMVEARAEFLAAGHYRPIADAVVAAALAAELPAGALAEIGSGTGYYLDAAARVLREREQGLECAVGIDLSKPAAAHAARRHPDLEFVVADAEVRIPLGDSAATVVLSVFAPRPGAELGRVVRLGGELIVAFAGPRHLERLRERLDLIGIHEDKLERLSKRLEPWFDLASTTPVEYEIRLGAEDAGRLVLMGPNAWHGFDPAALEGEHTDLVSVLVSRFRRSEALPGADG
jgi:23S rRNA (guanine745-N1)-methyltransferase